MKLRKYLVPEFILGDGAISLAGRYASNFQAKKALIVTDPGIIEIGWVKFIENSLKEAEIKYEIFDRVTPNPKDYEVMEGADVFENQKCDIIISIGGGSPMDCAKGIGIVSSNKRHINEFEGVDMVKIPMPPVICLPTTAGTAADISQFAIITNTTIQKKIAIISKAVVPDISIIDGATTTTMDYNLTAATGMDALVHAVEAYVSNASSCITDISAIEAIKLINGNLVKVLNDPNNMVFRNNMVQGSLLAGMAFSNASLGLVHAMAHSLGGLKDSPHGECNSILLEHSIDYNFYSAVEKYTSIFQAMGGEIKNKTNDEIKSGLFDLIQKLRKEVEIDFNLSQLNVEKKDLHQLAFNAFEDACLATNPKEITVKQIRGIYERIF